MTQSKINGFEKFAQIGLRLSRYIEARLNNIRSHLHHIQAERLTSTVWI